MICCGDLQHGKKKKKFNYYVGAVMGLMQHDSREFVCGMISVYSTRLYVESNPYKEPHCHHAFDHRCCTGVLDLRQGSIRLK